MPEDGSYSIRFKRGAVEFELTSTAEQVSAVWTSIESSVVDAFAAGEVEEEEETEQVEPSNGSDKTRTRRRRTTRRRAPSAAGGRGGRAEIVSKLAEADLTKFPKLPTRPSALMVA